jgi:mono/diheme cytochrome c family protein
MKGWMQRLRNRLAAGLCLALPLLAGCQQKMAAQPSYRDFDPTTFFEDGQSARHLPAGTVARGHLRTDTHLYTGRKTAAPQQGDAGANRGQQGQGGEATAEDIRETEARMVDFVETFPFPVTRAVLEHGYHRYMIFCVVCHDPLGRGRGKIVERGYTPPPSFHIERLRTVPVGHIFAVISEGYGSMPSYGGQIPPRDRWAIAAYVRALQLSQHFPEDELTDAMREKMREAAREEAP